MVVKANFVHQYDITITIVIISNITIIIITGSLGLVFGQVTSDLSKGFNIIQNTTNSEWVFHAIIMMYRLFFN